MGKMFESIMQSFDETIAASKKRTLKESLVVIPVKVFDASSIRNLRQQLGMTQSIFAGVFGVSVKTVEAWESGKNVPNGPSLRMMELLSQDQSVVRHFLTEDYYSAYS